MSGICLKERFNAEGFVVYEDFLSANDLSDLREMYDSVIHASSVLESVQCKSLLWIKNPEALLGDNLEGHRVYQTTKNLASDLLGTTPANIVIAPRIFYKPSGSRETLPHQEAEYLKSTTSNKLNFWVPLDDADINSGCMQFVSGSHKGGLAPHIFDDTDERKITLYIPNLDRSALKCFPMKAGQASAHHNLTIHGATENSSAFPRRSLVLICEPR